MKSVFRSFCRPASYLTTLVSHSRATSLTFLSHAHIVRHMQRFGGIVQAGTYRTICIQARMQTEVTPAVCTILITTREPPASSRSSPTFPLMTCVWAACPDPLMDPYSLAKHTYIRPHAHVRAQTYMI